MFMSGVDQLLPLFMMIFIGLLLGKTGAASPEFRGELTDLCFLVLFPASVVNSFNMTLDMEKLRNGAKLVLIGFLWIAVPLLLALILTRLVHMEAASANVLVFSCAFCNYGFAGLGIVSSLYGGEGIFYANMLALTYNLINMPVGLWIMERGSGKQSAASIKSVLKSPPVLAILIMLPLVVLDLRLPQVVYETAGMLTGCLSPIGMLVTGMSVSDYSLEELVTGRACYLVSALRLLILPAAMGAMMVGMKIEGVALAAPLLIMGMPVAANCLLLAQKYDGNKRLAAQCVLISTMLSLLTIPILVFFGGA